MDRIAMANPPARWPPAEVPSAEGRSVDDAGGNASTRR
jgi:hypothetical protein